MPLLRHLSRRGARRRLTFFSSGRPLSRRSAVGAAQASAGRRPRQSTPSTIATRNVKAAPTTMMFSGLVKLMEWPPMLPRRRILTRECRIQNKKSMLRRKNEQRSG